MKIEAINIEETIENTKRLLNEDPSVSSALKSSINLLLVLVTLLLNKMELNKKRSVLRIHSQAPEILIDLGLILFWFLNFELKTQWKKDCFCEERGLFLL